LDFLSVAQGDVARCLAVAVPLYKLAR